MRISPRRTSPLVRTLLWLAALLYVGALIYIVFFSRRRSSLVWSPALVNLVPLINTIRDHEDIADIGRWNYWNNIIGNIGLFMPLPTLVASLSGLRSKRWLLAIGVAVSVLIECTQYVFRIGVPDIDDVIFNSTGVAIGIVIWELVLRKVYRRLAY